jgi:DNA-entry nuclease
MEKRRMSRIRRQIAVFFALLLFACAPVSPKQPADSGMISVQAAIQSLPSYSDQAYVEVNDNEPEFTKKEKKNTKAFETYSKLDKLGRCGVAYANICEEIMPTEDRGEISSVHPSGWQSGMGWERCHLIGFQLAGENANKKNLITGTHYLNVTGMLPFENMVADYVKETNNHVLYRVTPYFEGNNLIASGVQMEAWSVEDGGDGICFNVYVFNVQPGSTIDYATGTVKNTTKSVQYITDGTYSKTFDASSLGKKAGSFKIGCQAQGTLTYKKVSGSKALSVSKTGKVTVKKGTEAGTYKLKVRVKAAATGGYKSRSMTKTITVTVTDSESGTDQSTDETASYILNTSTKVFHYPSCSSVKQMSAKNTKSSAGTRDEIIEMGYRPCGRCKP